MSHKTVLQIAGFFAVIIIALFLLNRKRRESTVVITDRDTGAEIMQQCIYYGTDGTEIVHTTPTYVPCMPSFHENGILYRLDKGVN